MGYEGKFQCWCRYETDRSNVKTGVKCSFGRLCESKKRQSRGFKCNAANKMIEQSFVAYQFADDTVAG